jgi:putative RNA 2'-phosphotransferase
MKDDLARLSKTVSYALRHNPQEYGLQLDSEGWVPIEDLLHALHQRRSVWRHISSADLATMIAESEKQRFEIHAGKIRAFYGHSTDKKIEKQPATPPAILYHGTTPQAAHAIRREGLRSMQRQYVHLCTNEQTARTVALRHTAQPVILRIHALEAHRQGVQFYIGNQETWLADDIAPAFLQFQEQ